MAALAGARSVSGHPVRFVAALPKGRRRKAVAGPSYEEKIHTTGEVPTREGSWHDFFNALAWAHFPLTKAALNARQIAAAPSPTAENRAAGRVRSREQDRLAMLDEGGVLRAGERTFLIGHAVMEEAVQGRMSANVFVLDVEAEPELSAVDAAAAAQILAGRLAEPSAGPSRLAELFP